MHFIEIKVNNRSYLFVNRVRFSNGFVIWYDMNGKRHVTSKYRTIVIHHHTF